MLKQFSRILCNLYGILCSSILLKAFCAEWSMQHTQRNIETYFPEKEEKTVFGPFTGKIGLVNTERCLSKQVRAN